MRRSGALDERYASEKPVPARPGSPDLRYDDLRLEVFVVSVEENGFAAREWRRQRRRPIS